MIRQKTLERACPVCKANNNLVYCAGCKVMPYCGRDHQDAHGGAHENQCTKVKNTREELQAEDIKLRNVEGDSATAANPFETSVGHFWSIMETRDYMRARYEHIEALLQIDQLDATIAGRDHIEDMLRLCRSDNMYLRDLLPSLYLRLGQDQQCYDFIKWYFTEGQRGDYDWGNMDLPFLNLVDEDAFENPEVFLHPSGELAHKLAIMLLKIRLLFDLRRLQKSKALYTQTELPQEVKDEISRNLVGNITANIERLEKQIDQLHESIDKSNEHFWPALIDPGDSLSKLVLNMRPGRYPRGKRQETWLKLQFTYPSWIETPGAIEYVEAMRSGRN